DSRVPPPLFPSVLDLEKPTAHRASGYAEGCACLDPRALYGESALGCTADPRRAPEAGHLGESVHRRQVHATPPAVTITNVAHLPHKPRPPVHGGRFLRRADGHV